MRLRFIALHSEGEQTVLPVNERSFPNRWVLSRLNHAIISCMKSLEEYRFDRATSSVYQFLWHEYCDWYIELIKPALQNPNSHVAQSTRQTLFESFEVIQRLLHPFMPFLSEELWQAFPHSGKSIVTQPFPTANEEWNAPDVETAFETFEQFVMTSRTSRALLNCSPIQPMVFWGTTTNHKERASLFELNPYLAHMVRGSVNLTEEDDWPKNNILRLVVGYHNSRIGNRPCNRSPARRRSNRKADARKTKRSHSS